MNLFGTPPAFRLVLLLVEIYTSQQDQLHVGAFSPSADNRNKYNTNLGFCEYISYAY